MKKKWPHKTVRKYCGFIGNIFVFKVTRLHRAVILHKQKTRKTLRSQTQKETFSGGVGEESTLEAAVG